MRVGVVILNRNEAEALPHVLPKIDPAMADEMFAIDGNSTDGSPQMIRDHGIEVVEQTTPGRGEAFRLAFDHARGRLDALIFFSPDGNEDPADIPKFKPLLEAGADIVIASRMMEGAVNEEDVHLFRPRKWANLTFSAMARQTWGRKQPKITDPINGYRAITVAAWDRLALDGAGYTIEYQSSIRAYQLGLRVVEFPTVEGQRIGGESDAKAIDTGLKFLRLYGSEVRRSRQLRQSARS